jgi:hypothetical protein
LPDTEVAEAVQVHDFAALEPGEAARLEGKKAVYRVRLLEETAGGVYEIDAPDDVIGLLSCAPTWTAAPGPSRPSCKWAACPRRSARTAHPGPRGRSTGWRRRPSLVSEASFVRRRRG